ncbi:MAG: APC family permease [Promethearchaeota archaeon]
MDSKQPPHPDKDTESSSTHVSSPSTTSTSVSNSKSTSTSNLSPTTTVPPSHTEKSTKKTKSTKSSILSKLSKLIKPKSKPDKPVFGLREMLGQGLGGTIGGPIFVILGYALSVARSGLLVSFFINGLLMLGFVLVFSELALSLPVSGGGYSFSKEAIGGAQGFLIGWLIWIGNLLFIAISGLGFSFSLIIFLPDRWIGPVSAKIIGFSIVLVFFLMNLLYPKVVKSLLKFMTYSIVFGFIVYILGGLIFGPVYNPDFSTAVFREPFSFTSVLSMTAYTFVIYCVYEWNSAFENMTAAFDSIKRPRKTIPRAFIFSILIAIAIYWLVAFVTLINIGSFESSAATTIMDSDAPLADAFGLILNGSIGIYFMGLIGMIATMTSINSGLQMSSHMLNSMARDGFIPKVVKKTRKNVQWIPLTLSTVLALGITIIFNVEIITEVSNFIFLLSMIFLSLSLIILRRTRPNLIRPWKIPFYPVLPIILIVGSVVLISTMFVSALGIFGISFGVIIVLIGGIYYLFQISRRDRISLILHGSKLGANILVTMILLLTQMNFVGRTPPLGGIPPLLPNVRNFIYIMLGLGIFSILFDIVSVRRWLLFLTKRNRDVVVVSGIMQLGAKMERGAQWINKIVIFGHFLFSFCFFVLVGLFQFNFVNPISPLFPSEVVFLRTILLAACLLLGTIFLISGVVRLMAEQEYLRMRTGSDTE